MSGDLVLVTGGTGVVGTSLIEELQSDGEQVACLVHSTPLEDDSNTIECLQGNLTKPDLGLDHGAWEELARRVRAVVHCAAVVEFNADRKIVHGLNVRGTDHILDFAAQADAPIIYCSSAFIARAEMLEGEEAGIAGGLAEYLHSKKLAEELVRNSGVPYSIIRPPLLFSDTRTGRITREQAFHKVLRGISTGTLPFLPWAPEAHVDYIPQDQFAKAIASLLRYGKADGGEYWATAGPNAITTGDLVQTCVDTMARHGVEVDPVPMFDVEMVKRLIVPAFLGDFDEKDQRKFHGLISLAMVFGTHEPFPCNWNEIPGNPHHPTLDELRDALALTVERTFSPAAEESGELAAAG